MNETEGGAQGPRRDEGVGGAAQEVQKQPPAPFGSKVEG